MITDKKRRKKIVGTVRKNGRKKGTVRKDGRMCCIVGTFRKDGRKYLALLEKTEDI